MPGDGMVQMDHIVLASLMLLALAWVFVVGVYFQKVEDSTNKELRGWSIVVSTIGIAWFAIPAMLLFYFLSSVVSGMERHHDLFFVLTVALLAIIGLSLSWTHASLADIKKR